MLPKLCIDSVAIVHIFEPLQIPCLIGWLIKPVVTFAEQVRDPCYTLNLLLLLEFNAIKISMNVTKKFIYYN